MPTTLSPLQWNPSWLRDARAHMGGSWDIPNTDSEPGKSKWLAKGNLEEMPHISDLNYHAGTTLSLSSPVCLATHTLLFFFLLINTSLVSLLSVFVGILFCKAEGPGPCHWPLVWWLGFGALTAMTQPQSLARNWNPASSCCRPRPLEIIWTQTTWVQILALPVET